MYIKIVKRFKYICLLYYRYDTRIFDITSAYPSLQTLHNIDFFILPYRDLDISYLDSFILINRQNKLLNIVWQLRNAPYCNIVTIITTSNNKTIGNKAFCFNHIIEFNPKHSIASEYYYIVRITTKSTVCIIFI